MLTFIDFVFCILGWIVYSLFDFKKYKDSLDKKDIKFSFKEYTKLTWDNWLFTLICSICFLLMGPQILILLSNNLLFLQGIVWSYKIAFFLGAFAGTLFNIIYNQLITKFK